MNPWLGIFAVLAFLGALIGALVFFRGRLGPELSRKAVHVGMGLVCLSFPWIFRESWPVIVLAALAIIGLATVRVIPFLRKDVGAVLGGVERESLGEFYFPLAVAAVFLLAGGDALLYMIPILTLAVADSVGALVGVRYGFARYRTDEGLKSAEGSVAFFIAAFLSCQSH
jgi:phytol kinase